MTWDLSSVFRIGGPEDLPWIFRVRRAGDLGSFLNIQHKGNLGSFMNFQDREVWEILLDFLGQGRLEVVTKI